MGTSESPCAEVVRTEVDTGGARRLSPTRRRRRGLLTTKAAAKEEQEEEEGEEEKQEGRLRRRRGLLHMSDSGDDINTPANLGVLAPAEGQSQRRRALLQFKPTATSSSSSIGGGRNVKWTVFIAVAPSAAGRCRLTI
jgi:hypothetical protein